MARTWILTGLSVLALVAGAACKSKGDDKSDLKARCDQLAKVCSDTDKHIAKLAEECKQAAEKQRTNGCVDQALAAYDCFETELCGKAEKVWTLDDVRVLADRHAKCVAQADALRACVEK